MPELSSISIDEFKARARRAGLELSDKELEELKPMYEHFMGPVAAMHELDLDAEDLAVVFSPNWDPR